MLTRWIPILAGLFLALLFVFSLGMWTSHKGWYPSHVMLMVRNMYRSISDTGTLFPPGVYAARGKGVPQERHTVFRPDDVTPGYWIVNRIMAPEFRYGADLIDENGDVVHSWPIDYSKIVEGGESTQFVHVATPLRDGSILVNFDEGNALARLDACGDVMWSRTEQVYHHTIRPDPDAGGYWTWEANLWDGGHDHRMVRFDENTGQTLESIDLISDVMAQNPESELTLNLPEDFDINRNLVKDQKRDIFHPNEVTPLPAAFADAFPQFSAGDLLISLRNISLVAVIDRKTHEIIWAHEGPWNRQHDPDWHPDGTITVYSNYTHRFRTTIIEIDPQTNRYQDRFRGSGVHFSPYIMGQHDQIPSGNWLITSPTQGRVFEVTDDGEMVRNWNNLLNQKYNASVPHAEFVEPDFFPKSLRAADDKRSGDAEPNLSIS